MSLGMWSEMAQVPVICRGCEEHLSPVGELWEDRRGIVVCVKASAESVGTGERPDYVFHQPMPAGLAGSPGA